MKTKLKPRDAYYLTQDTSYYLSWHNGIATGWNHDNRGGVPKVNDRGPYPLNDVSDKFGTAMIRDLTETNKGIVVLETEIKFLSGFDGFYLLFTDKNEDLTYKLYTDHNAIYLINDKKKSVKLVSDAGSERHFFKVILDFEEYTAETIIDSVSYGTTPLLSDNIKTYQIGTTEKAILHVEPGITNIYVNYAVNEEFSLTENGKVPYDWNSISSTRSRSSVEKGEYVLQSRDGFPAEAQKSFLPVSGKVCFESMFFLPEKASGAVFALLGKGKPAVSFSIDSDALSANGQKLRPYLAEMWYRLRIEADTKSKTALVKLNGKELATVPFEHAILAIDQIRFTLASEKEASLRFDNVKLFSLIDHKDYVPEPVIPARKETYHVGMNMCSLWHTGGHIGWDCISPYDEIRPVLGYYDEGLPEVADWEIKFMLENGVDFQLYCWYSTQSNAPLKTTVMSEAIHDGLFNAKYSDKMKFALLWEAANAVHPAGSEAFRRYFVPYWVEQFFIDKRYMTIDNKAVIGVFGVWQLVKDFGSEEGVKAEFDYLREVLKGLGYADAIIMCCCGSSDIPTLTSVKNCGFDAVYAYNWGGDGYSRQFTQKAIEAQREKNVIQVVPTASTGFNNVAWAGTRRPNMTVEDFRDLHLWFRDGVLKQYDNQPEEWKNKFVMLSNWNEYGEGTYIMPSGLNGFGYMEALREVYTDGGKCTTNIVPTKKQLARLGYMFPQDRATIRPLRHYEFPVPTEIYHTFDFTDKASAELWEVQEAEASFQNGALVGKTTESDPKLITKTPLSLEVSKVTHISFRMKTNQICGAELFYITKENPNWSQNQSIGFRTSPDKDVVSVNISGKSSFSGELIGLRLDPAAFAGAEFTLYGIDLLYDPNKPSCYIDDKELSLDVEPVIENGIHLIPFNPETAIGYFLNAYYTWNRKKGIFTLSANGGSCVFKMGSKSAIINGKEVTLDCKPHLADGMPMIPVEVIAKAFKYKVKSEGNTVTILTK